MTSSSQDTEKMTLSEKECNGKDLNFYKSEDVKEFIRLLKEEFIKTIPVTTYYSDDIIEEINKLAGDELI